MKKLQLLTLPGCVHCEEFKKWWHNEASKEFDTVEYEEIDGVTPAGQKMVQEYGIMAAPGIIIDGELFSTGGFDKKKISEALRG